VHAPIVQLDSPVHQIPPRVFRVRLAITHLQDFQPVPIAHQDTILEQLLDHVLLVNLGTLLGMVLHCAHHVLLELIQMPPPRPQKMPPSRAHLLSIHQVVLLLVHIVSWDSTSLKLQLV
jgi:hypothetical protein